MPPDSLMRIPPYEPRKRTAYDKGTNSPPRDERKGYPTDTVGQLRHERTVSESGKAYNLARQLGKLSRLYIRAWQPELPATYNRDRAPGSVVGDRD